MTVDLTNLGFGPSDVRILRDLAARQREIAAEPVMEERRRLWRRHNGLEGERPMVIAETVDLLRSGELFADAPLACASPAARSAEAMLRAAILSYERIGDDSVVDPWFGVMGAFGIGDYGVAIGERHTENSAIAVHYDPPLKDLGADLCRLWHRRFTYDREATRTQAELLDAVFGDILPVRVHPMVWPLWTMGMTWDAIKLVGMENLMLSMVDDPDAVHRLMLFLRDDFLGFTDWMEREGLLYLNNANDYVGSGGRGFTDVLPQKDWRPGDPVRTQDMWVLLESQETVGISPDMFEEFIFPYQEAIADRFGLTYYGCCEPLDQRWRIVKRLRNLRSVSVSPWCDQTVMAAVLGRDYVYSRKPHPAYISGDSWSEEELRRDVRGTIRVAQACEVEFILKDVHTVGRQPDRLGRWVRMVREEIEDGWNRSAAGRPR